MKEPKLAYISINGQTIRQNKLRGETKPPIRLARGRSDSKPKYGHRVVINGPSRLIYDPESAILRCGARLVLMAKYDDVEIFE